MSPQQKQKYFDMLVDVGFKEIEISYPSSSETEFKFTRSLVEGHNLPDDLWLQVCHFFAFKKKKKNPF